VLWPGFARTAARAYSDFTSTTFLVDRISRPWAFVSLREGQAAFGSGVAELGSDAFPFGIRNPNAPLAVAEVVVVIATRVGLPDRCAHRLPAAFPLRRPE
jgi:hypothetical protein